jgi:hypothetical protein
MPEARKRIPVVPAKAKIATEFLLQSQNYDLTAAARYAGLQNGSRLRDLLKRPHIRNYMWHARRAVVEEVCLGNPPALARVRDSSDNGMAVVGAVRQAEAMRETAIAESRGIIRREAPGLVIIIEGGGGRGDQVIGGEDDGMLIEGSVIDDAAPAPDDPDMDLIPNDA